MEQGWSCHCYKSCCRASLGPGQPCALCTRLEEPELEDEEGLGAEVAGGPGARGYMHGAGQVVEGMWRQVLGRHVLEYMGTRG